MAAGESEMQEGWEHAHLPLQFKVRLLPVGFREHDLNSVSDIIRRNLGQAQDLLGAACLSSGDWTPGKRPCSSIRDDKRASTCSFPNQKWVVNKH